MRLPLLRRRRQPEDPTPSSPDNHDGRLRTIRPMHFEPDDEGHTREDKERERKARDADRMPPFFG
jgi:hypothetical protein